MSGFLHQHFGTEYEPVITFVDSPPNSEESWPDDQSKGSPGPQIIDVQTIYSNGGTRKRRMDWDPLDLGQSESNASPPTGELPAKLSPHQLADLKDKGYKKEKLSSGRNNWTDDIGFDLNAEFNSNSYLNNESFMSFSSGLQPVLKQEPQADQLKISNKTSLHNIPSPVSSLNIPKHDKQPTTANNSGLLDSTPSPSTQLTASETPDKHKSSVDLIDNHCACGSPQGNSNHQQQQQQLHQAVEQSSPSIKGTVVNNEQARQLLTVVDASKIEQNSLGRTGSVTPIAASNAVVANSDDYKFQYILAAATSIATKNNEDTLTYLNQGQSYEIKLKKIGDLSMYRDKILKSVIKICFHERRLQYMEREQMQQWQASRPGERIIEVDLPLSYGLCHVSQPLNPNYLNTVEIFWDPMKEVGVYIKVNCISTEFTPKKHGGEKGVPFRLQIETYLENNNNNPNSGNSNANGNTGGGSNITGSGTKTPPTIVSPPSPLGSGAANAGGVTADIGSPHSQTGNLTPNNMMSTSSVKQPIHAAACQVKVFKLKGADRKHKQDREKIQKRPQSEQDKFQPSYECTIMTDIPLDLITSTPTTTAGCFSPEYMKIWPNSPVHIPKYDGILSYASASPNANAASPIAINSVSSTNSPNLKIMDTNMVTAPAAMATDTDDYNSITIMPESTPVQVTQWLTYHRLTSYLSTFAQFSGADIMRMSKEDLIQICGLADGIRMFNILRAKAITPRLTLYVSLDGSNYNAIYLISNTAKELLQKLFKLPGFYECVAMKSSASLNGGGGGIMENSSPFHSWSGGGMHSKYSGSGSSIYNDVNSKSLIYITGPSGIHVAITDEVLTNEIKDGSLYGLEVQNGKVIMKLMNKNEN
ncbi:transcription factor CP2 like gemini isoform X2 [Haematobia irritans]